LTPLQKVIILKKHKFHAFYLLDRAALPESKRRFLGEPPFFFSGKHVVDRHYNRTGDIKTNVKEEPP
jgi:hypothetical protein